MKMIYGIFIAVAFITTASCQEQHTVKVTVTEEEGSPIEGVDTIVTFLGYDGNQTVREEGVTNAQGVFEARGAALLRMSVRMEKPGYYKTSSGRLSRKKDHDVTFILRKKNNPIPLYSKGFGSGAPVSGKEFGYDFLIGDWVAPYGKGKIKDLVLKGNMLRDNDRYFDYHYELEIGFANEKDGFITIDQVRNSTFKSPYEAPDDGDYKKSWKYFKKRKPGEGQITNANSNVCYIFRLRTKVDSAGNIVSCHYAKAYGDFPNPIFYYNPTANDRNLEFDPKRNLFADLKNDERVSEP